MAQISTDLEIVSALSRQFIPVGSRVTCNPAPTDTDADYLVEVQNLDEFSACLARLGWEDGGSEIAGNYTSRFNPNRFISFRKGENNVIATESREFFDKFSLATSVAKTLNLLSKDDRVTLFSAILYGITPFIDDSF